MIPEVLFLVAPLALEDLAFLCYPAGHRECVCVLVN